MKTLQVRFSEETTLLIPGVKGKLNREGEIENPHTERKLQNFVQALLKLTDESTGITIKCFNGLFYKTL